MKTIILCGGQGTRLGQLTYNCPKPLLQIGGRPWLDRVIMEYRKHGLRDFVLVAGWRGDMIRDAYTEWGKWRGLNIQVLIDPKPTDGMPMGTLQALVNVNKEIDLGQRFLLANGDTLVRTDTSPQNFGGRAMAFRIQQKDCGLRLIRTDVLVGAISKLPIPTAPLTIEAGLFPSLPLKWQSLDAASSMFIDIGTPEDLARAKVIFR